MKNCMDIVIDSPDMWPDKHIIDLEPPFIFQLDYLEDTHNYDDPDKWGEKNKHIFTGGRYIESYDSEFTNIYKKIVSNGVYHLFNLRTLH